MAWKKCTTSICYIYLNLVTTKKYQNQCIILEFVKLIDLTLFFISFFSVKTFFWVCLFLRKFSVYVLCHLDLFLTLLHYFQVFFFHGRLVCGPDPRGLLLTTVSIILSSWIFSVYIGQDLPNRSGLIVTISEILTLLVSTLFFFFLSFFQI